jgi:hypothetical protein
LKCEKCGKEIDGKFGSGRFCSRFCANSRIHSEETKRKIGKSVNKYFDLQNKKIKYCKYCGSEKNKCKVFEVCKKYRIFPTLIKYFGFDESKIGTKQIYEEYYRIRNLLIEDYYDNKLSLPDLIKKYKHNNIRNFSKIINSLEIKLRNLSESRVLTILNGKNILNNFKNSKYKHGWHTTWNNKKVFYRSSLELNYANKLDEQKIDYEMETLRILYWDSQKLIQRVAIPDFYLPDKNKIIEIKCDYTLDKQNMKDKEIAYKQHGYKFELIIN